MVINMRLEHHLHEVKSSKKTIVISAVWGFVSERLPIIQREDGGKFVFGDKNREGIHCH